MTFRVSPKRLAQGEWEEEKHLREGDIYASYSADRIASGQSIRSPFLFGGELWVCTSIIGKGISMSQEGEFGAYELVPIKLFTENILTYSDRTSTLEASEAARQDPFGFYHGIVVKHSGTSFVLKGPPAIFTGRAEESPESAQLSLF